MMLVLSSAFLEQSTMLGIFAVIDPSANSDPVAATPRVDDLALCKDLVEPSEDSSAPLPSPYPGSHTVDVHFESRAWPSLIQRDRNRQQAT